MSGECVDTIRNRRHNVVTTTKTADALSQLRRHSFDALVMDYEQQSVDVV
jgi:CheY-like chemotaxis protein